MGCKFCDFDGQCELWDEEGITFEHIAISCDEDGHCLVKDDPDPTMSCEDYEES